MNGKPPWTDRRDAWLRELCQQGLSAGQIAVELGGVTRNAVIERASRLGVDMAKGVGRPRTAVRKPKRREVNYGSGASIAPVRNRGQSFRALAMKSRPVVPNSESLPVPAIDQQADAPVTLFDLQPHHCRWPIGDGPILFCADTKLEGRSYCPRHFGIAIRG
jgi:GcrA cell cycle regulator